MIRSADAFGCSSLAVWHLCGQVNGDCSGSSDQSEIAYKWSARDSTFINRMPYPEVYKTVKSGIAIQLG